MYVKMKWVYQTFLHRGVSMEAGQQPSLCFKGRKHMLCVAAGHPVRVLKRPVGDFDKLRDVSKGGGDYPIDEAVDQFRRIGARNGITQGALRLLSRAEQELYRHQPLEDEGAYQNEEELVMVEQNKADEGKADTANDTKTTNETAANAAKEKTMSTKSKTAKAKGKAPAKAKGKAKSVTTKAKANGAAKAEAKSVEVKKGAPKLREGSTVHRAYEWWKAELLKQDNPKDLDRGVRKDISERMNEKFGIKSGASYYQYFTKHFGLPK